MTGTKKTAGRSQRHGGQGLETREAESTRAPQLSVGAPLHERALVAFLYVTYVWALFAVLGQMWRMG